MSSDIINRTNILIIGLGGIGSQLTELIVPALEISGLQVELNLMDGDSVEPHNLAHQRFTNQDLNQSKVVALTKRHSTLDNIKIIGHELNLTSVNQLDGYDLIVVAVDREQPRKMVHDSKAQWLDLRCQGDGWLMIDSDTDKTILNNIPQNTQAVSCQLPGAIDGGNIEFGFAAVAAIGAQWVTQKVRIVNGFQSKVPKFSMGYLTYGVMNSPISGGAING